MNLGINKLQIFHPAYFRYWCAMMCIRLTRNDSEEQDLFLLKLILIQQCQSVFDTVTVSCTHNMY